MPVSFHCRLQAGVCALGIAELISAVVFIDAIDHEIHLI